VYLFDFDISVSYASFGAGNRHIHARR